MSQAFDVVCAGIVVVDHLAAPVDALPAAGQLVLTDECFLSIGGCASNVAVDLARMGVRAAIAGCVGNDSFGQFARGVLEQHGVDTHCLVVSDRASTSQTLILNVRGEDRRFIHHVGANAVYSAEHLPREQIRRAKVFYVGGYFLMDRLTPAALAEVFRDARAHGVLTMLDVVTPGPMDYLAALEVLLPQTDYFMPNCDEGTLMTGLSTPLDQAERFRAMGAGTVVITCGGSGSVLVSGDRRLRAGVYPVPFVDGTGGGDAFDAGFICGLLEGASPERRLALGSALGASCVRQTGATDGVFTRPQAEAFIRERQLSIESI
jgi:sugar/nucleoside kinase (ribokinase family)